MQFNPTEHPHRRYNPLLGEYVLVSPHRTQRPWQGKVEPLPAVGMPPHDPECYLCPRTTRKSGDLNPDYADTFVFTNDFAALIPDVPSAKEPVHPLLTAQAVRGTSRVICFSPRHDLTLAKMDHAGILKVIDLWAEQTQELGASYKWVQVFENRGEMMGSSNPHPHGQIWAQDQIPGEPQREDEQQAAYYQANGVQLLVEYARLEAEQRERVVAENETWLAVVPFWAVWPFEILLIPRAHVRRITDLDASQGEGLARILKEMLTRYDNLFEIDFPYSMGWHGAPYNGANNDHWQLHAHFFPPLLRSATVRKFMVGYELLAEPQRDLTAEQGAARLREMPAEHYLKRQA